MESYRADRHAGLQCTVVAETEARALPRRKTHDDVSIFEAGVRYLTGEVLRRTSTRTVPSLYRTKYCAIGNSSPHLQYVLVTRYSFTKSLVRLES